MKELANLFLNFISFLQTVNSGNYYVILAIYAVLLWCAVLTAIVRDANKRYVHGIGVFLVFVICLFPPNAILYLLFRPPVRTDDNYWLELERRYIEFETQGLEKCSCGTLLKPNYLVCPSCGRSLRKLCENCKGIIELDWKLCPFCLTSTGYIEEHQLIEKKESRIKVFFRNGILSVRSIYPMLREFYKDVYYSLEWIFNSIQKIWKNLIRIFKNNLKVKRLSSIKDDDNKVYYKEVKDIGKKRKKISNKKNKKHGHKNRKNK